MKFVIQPSMADAFRRDDGTLPDNVVVWDGQTCAAGGDEKTWLGDSVAMFTNRLPKVTEPVLAVSPAPVAATFKGKRIAQWKQERSSRYA